MIEFPSTAFVGKTIPKDAFYNKLSVNGKLKEKFVSDVEKFVIKYVLTARSMRVDESEEIAEIDVLSVSLKGNEIDSKILETIARNNSHKLLFEVCSEDKIKLALYHGKLYMTQWADKDAVSVAVCGNSMQSLWDGFVSQIAIHGETDAAKQTATVSKNIDDELVRNAKIAKLKREIEKLDRRSRAEIQPGIKFDIFKKYQQKCKELEQVENGGGDGR